MVKRDANLAKCTEHDSKQRAIVDCLCTRLYQLLLSQDCLWTRLVHLLLSQLSCGRVVQALLSRKALVFKEGWAAYQPVFKGRLDRFSAAGLQGWTAFQQLAFRPLCKQFRAAFFVNRGVAELSASQMLCGREGAPVTVWAGQALPQPCRRRTSRSARRALPINRASGRNECHALRSTGDSLGGFCWRCSSPPPNLLENAAELFLTYSVRAKSILQLP